MEASIEELNIGYKAIEVLYCGNCGGVPEYCEFGSKQPACKEWLREADQKLFLAIHPLDTETSSTPITLIDAKSTKKKVKVVSRKITITTHERTKRKRVTHIMGLELFAIDLKKAAKLFANKFATGASVSATGAGEDEIVIQGDCGFELAEFVVEKFGVGEDDVAVLEGKKK